jgi:hypothetical protein
VTTRPQFRLPSWTRTAVAVFALATIAVTIAARPAPIPAPGVSIVSATATRLSDSKRGPSRAGPTPVLELPRGYTYRVSLSGQGIDLVQTIVPGSSVLSISNVRRRNGLETRGHGMLLFNVAVNSQSPAYRRIPITFRYVTGQTDRMFVEVHPGGRVTSMTPLVVPADQPVTITYTGRDLSAFVLSGEGFRMQRVVERSPSRVRIEYVFPAKGPNVRYATLGSKPTGPDDIFAFAGLRAISVTGAQPGPRSIPVRPPTVCQPTLGKPCP